MPYGHASMLLLGETAKRPSHTTNTIKFDRIPFDPCNSIKKFDLCPFDQKNSAYLQPSPSLKFTLESEDNEGGLSFLDMRVEHVGNKIEASWYTKKTDTGVVVNYNSEAPFSSLASFQVSYIAYSIHTLRGLDFTMD